MLKLEWEGRLIADDLVRCHLPLREQSRSLVHSPPFLLRTRSVSVILYISHEMRVVGNWCCIASRRPFTCRPRLISHAPSFTNLARKVTENLKKCKKSQNDFKSWNPFFENFLKSKSKSKSFSLEFLEIEIEILEKRWFQPEIRNHFWFRTRLCIAPL